MTTYCKNCFYDDNHPLGLIVDESGECTGCKVHKEKYDGNWDSRFDELKKLTKLYKNKSEYDCIVPIDGDGDSFYIMHVVVNILGLKPLIVVYNNHFLSKEGHANIARIRMAFNVDMQMYVPSLGMIKEIIKLTMFRLNSIYWHVHAGKTSFPVWQAIKWNVP